MKWRHCHRTSYEGGVKIEAGLFIKRFQSVVKDMENDLKKTDYALPAFPFPLVRERGFCM